MILTLAAVADRIEAVLAGTLSRLDADHWFIEIMDLDSRGDVAFVPANDEARIRRAIWCLQAPDLSDEAGSYLVSDRELRSALEEMLAVKPV